MGSSPSIRNRGEHLLIADKTGSELRVVHVFGLTPWYPVYSEGTDLVETESEEQQVEEDLQRAFEQ